MRRQRHSASEDDTAIDMTPMLDIVFIMLIFFIVTTSFIKEAGVSVNRPTSETAVRQERSNIVIAITPDGEIYMDKKNIDLRAVRSNVERQKAQNPESAVVIQADEAAATGILVKVMDQVRFAGVENVAIATQKQ